MIAPPATSFLVLADMWWDGWGLVWFVVMAAFWIAVIAGIVLLLRALARGPSAPGAHEALRVLEERYARGELSREEFVERRTVLTDVPPPPL